MTIHNHSHSSSPSLSSDHKKSCFRDLFIQLKAYLFKLAFRPDYTINRFLISLLEQKTPPYSTKPFHGVTSIDITISSSNPNLSIRLYTPIHLSNHLLPICVYFHGGGFVYSSPSSSQIDRFTHDFSRQLNSIVISVDYRLAPEHRYPCSYEDGFHVLKLIDDGFFNDSLPQNADFNRCFVMGESAGGNITHHVMIKANPKYHQFKRLNIAGFIPIQPFFGGEERTKSELRYADGSGLPLESSDWFWKAFLPVGSNRDHPAANVVGSKSVDISGLDFPPILVIIGGLDPLKDRDKEYCEWLKNSGKQVEKIEYPNATHGFSWFYDVPEYSMMIQDVGEFMKKHGIPHLHKAEQKSSSHVTLSIVVP